MILQHKNIFSICGLITGLLTTLIVNSEERINMQGTSIIGNKELPNILYIVPWKPASIPEMLELPLSTLISDSLEPIDRKTLLRKQYYQQILNRKNKNRRVTIHSKNTTGDKHVR